MPKYKVWLQYGDVITAKNKAQAREIFNECWDEMQETNDEDVIDKILKIKKLNSEQDINDADHPSRRAAIEIIECVIEPFHKTRKEVFGTEYYDLEDTLTKIINKYTRANESIFPRS